VWTILTISPLFQTIAPQPIRSIRQKRIARATGPGSFATCLETLVSTGAVYSNARITEA
jgi:hypothetical protein